MDRLAHGYGAHYRRQIAAIAAHGPAPNDEGLRLIFDVEADNLLDTATAVHCIVIADLADMRVYEYGPDRIEDGLAHLTRADVLIGHNVTAYDLPLLRKLCGWAPHPTCEIVDMLVASRTIVPHLGDLDAQIAAIALAAEMRGAEKATKLAQAAVGANVPSGKKIGSHALEFWGMRLGLPKAGVDIEDWSKWSPEMQARCISDVRITGALWRLLQPDAYSAAALALEHKAAAVCARITADGIPFDREIAQRLRDRLEQEKTDIDVDLALRYHGINFHSRAQLGAFLEKRGWRPERRTPKNGQPVIDDDILEHAVPVVCPELAPLAKSFTLGKLLGYLSDGDEAWLRHVAANGRIHGVVLHSGTPHARAKHFRPNLAQVPNPKKGSAYGKECRALFRAPVDWVFVTCDQANLQDRGLAHYLAWFDDGSYARAFATGIDMHWHCTAALGLVAAGTERDKENRAHTAVREGAKRFRYAFLYGAGAARLGHVLCDTVRAVQAIDPDHPMEPRYRWQGPPNEQALTVIGGRARAQFIAATPGLQQLKQTVEDAARVRGWLQGLDGRRIPIRSLHTALNYLCTCFEAVICKRWLVNLFDELNTRWRYGWDDDAVIVAWVHDEIAVCCRREIADEVGAVMVRWAVEAGERFQLRVPLAADYTVGVDWAGNKE
jgi:DNA polymerase I-like protein with 3'-5' exonuclease and polymerase domains